MSRTHHHSVNWGKDHLFGGRADRGGYGNSPGWWTSMFMNRPGRRRDEAVIHLILSGQIDPDEAVFDRTGGRKPHRYYW